MAEEPSTVITPPAGDPPAGNTPPAAPPAGDPPSAPPAGETPEAKVAREAAEAKAKEKPAEGPPEKYEFKLPDGVEIETAVLEQASAAFKELGLTQDKAQKLIDLQTKLNTEAATKQAEAWKTMNEGWVAEAKADKEIGGVKFDENVALAVKGVDALGTPKLKEYLTASGAGNHPEVIRLFTKLGRMVADDKLTFGGAPAAGAKSAAELFYPTMAKQ